MSVQGRAAIVTGVRAGLGRAHAVALARQGAKVVVNDIDPATEAVAQEIRAPGGQALAALGSAIDEAAVPAMVGLTKTHWGRAGILVNNAGILRDVSFAKMSVADFRTVADVHLIGAMICTKATWAMMRDQNYGRHRHDDFVLRPVWNFRASQLRRRQNGLNRSHAGLEHRGGEVRHPSQLPRTGWYCNDRSVASEGSESASLDGASQSGTTMVGCRRRNDARDPVCAGGGGGAAISSARTSF